MYIGDDWESTSHPVSHSTRVSHSLRKLPILNSRPCLCLFEFHPDDVRGNPGKRLHVYVHIHTSPHWLPVLIGCHDAYCDRVPKFLPGWRKGAKTTKRRERERERAILRTCREPTLGPIKLIGLYPRVGQTKQTSKYANMPADRPPPCSYTTPTTREVDHEFLNFPVDSCLNMLHFHICMYT